MFNFNILLLIAEVSTLVAITSPLCQSWGDIANCEKHVLPAKSGLKAASKLVL